MAWTKRTIPSTSWATNREPAFLLQEDGFNILQENGSRIILEESEYVPPSPWTARTIPS